MKKVAALAVLLVLSTATMSNQAIAEIQQTTQPQTAQPQTPQPQTEQSTQITQPQTAPTPATQPQTPPAQTAPTPATPPTPQECLERVRTMGPMLPKLLEGAGATIHTFIPDPAAYEKTLPPMDKVVEGKDKLNLKNWGGLAEAYLFAGNKDKAESIYEEFVKASKTVFEPTETYLAAVEGDFGMVYFNEKNYEKAEPLLLDSARLMEANLTYAISNNLISNYLCLSLIRDNQGNKEEAAKYASKLVDIAKRQREKTL